MTPDDPRFHQSWVLLWLCAWTPCLPPCLPRCLPPVIGVLVVAWVVVGCYWVCGCRELFGYGCSVLYVLNFLYFSCICLAFRVGIQMLDPSISRADIENRKNVEFSSHCHLAVFAGEKKNIPWFQQICEKNETWECTCTWNLVTNIFRPMTFRHITTGARFTDDFHPKPSSKIIPQNFPISFLFFAHQFPCDWLQAAGLGQKQQNSGTQTPRQKLRLAEIVSQNNGFYGLRSCVQFFWFPCNPL